MDGLGLLRADGSEPVARGVGMPTPEFFVSVASKAVVCGRRVGEGSGLGWEWDGMGAVGTLFPGLQRSVKQTIEGKRFAGVRVWAMFTGCGKSGKAVGCLAGWDNWEGWLRGDSNTEGTEFAEKRGVCELNMKNYSMEMSYRQGILLSGTSGIYSTFERGTESRGKSVRTLSGMHQMLVPAD